MPQFLSAMAAIALLLSQTMHGAAALSDTQGTAYTNAFAYLGTEGIVSGYPDGTGRPYNTLNRAEALKVIVASNSTLKSRAEWYQGHLPSIPLFFDVGRGDWFAPYVEAAFESGVVTGYSDGTFKPGRSLTVSEATALLMRSYGESEAGGTRTSQRIENNANQWYTPAVNAAIRRNVIGQHDRLKLGQPITRGQFFEMVYRMHSIKKSGAVAFADTTGAPAPAPTQVAAGGPVFGTPTAAPVTTGQPIIVSANPSTGGASINVGQPVNAGGAAQQAGPASNYFAISIPAVGIKDLRVIHPDDPFSSQGILAPLKDGVGHLFSYPGGGGKIMVYGHSSSYPWDTSEYTKIFRKVNELNPGDKIYVAYNGKVHTYEVTFEEAIPAEDTSRFTDNGTGEELILYTCWPPDSITQRYLIHAVPVSVQ